MPLPVGPIRARFRSRSRAATSGVGGPGDPAQVRDDVLREGLAYCGGGFLSVRTSSSGTSFPTRVAMVDVLRSVEARCQPSTSPGQGDS